MPSADGRPPHPTRAATLSMFLTSFSFFDHSSGSQEAHSARKGNEVILLSLSALCIFT